METTINRLFQGFTESRIECVNVESSSARREAYLDLQLLVSKEYRNVYASFDELVKVPVSVEEIFWAVMSGGN